MNGENRKVFFTQKGIGDTLMLQGAMENIYNITKEKQIVCLTTEVNKIIFKNNPYVEILDFKLKDKTIERSIKLLKRKGLDLIWLDYYDLFYSDSNDLKISFSKIPVIAEFVRQAGVSGEVELKPKIYLTDEEKKFGKFFDKNQIAIMSEGLSIFKRYPFLKFQEILDRLKSRFNFVQIGNGTDKKLDGALDLRGKYSIREVASILYNSDLFVGEVGALMHLARAVDTRAVIAYTKHEPPYLYEYIANKNVFSKYECDLCLKNKVLPYITEKSYCPKNFNCIKTVETEDMIKMINICMEEELKNKNLETKKVFVKKSEKENTVKSYFFSLQAISTVIINFYLFSLILVLSIHNYKNEKIKFKLFNFFTILKIKNKLKNLKKYYLFNFLPIFSIKNGLVKFFCVLPILKIKY